MSSLSPSSAGWILVLGLVLVTAGCNGGVVPSGASGDSDSAAPVTPVASQSFASERQEIWSDTPLEGETWTPTDIKEAIAPLPDQVLVAGRISAGEFEAFGDGEATFVLSQLPDEDHAGGDPDHADNCPFCKRKLKNAPKAIVRITDQNDQPLPVSADDWLGLSKDDAVSVYGSATYNSALNTVMVRASKISKRP